jgi:Tfp pilus assembly protein PilV
VEGVSLIEVMVGVVIFVFIILGLAKSIVNARRTGESSRALAEATTLALDKLEHLRTLLPIDGQLTAGTHTDAANPLRADGASNGIYTRTWTITSDLPLIGMKHVEMKISWRDGLGSHEIALATALSLA